MVHGLDIFKAYFEDYANYYVLIGGSACSVLGEEIGAPFRATKDLDIVLIIEEMDGDFGQKFWQFIKDGDYEHKQKGTGNNQFYRFTKPVNRSFPAMIELFSRKPDGLSLPSEVHLTPVPVEEDISSLSAILLDGDYYDLLKTGITVIDGVSVLNLESIIPFKIRAFVDLSDKKVEGLAIDSKSIAKHKKDVLRLMTLIPPGTRVTLKDSIKGDVLKFVERMSEEKPNLKALNINGITLEQLMKLMTEVYGIES